MIRFVLLLGLLLPLGAFAIYKPEYVVLETTGELEIRQYPDLIVARTRVEASFEDVGNVAFRRLAGYIFGNNAEKQKISMTAPVTMSPESAGNGAYWVSFFMPAEYQLADLPAPSDGLVEVTRVPAAKMAVLAYKGGWSEEKYDSHKVRLMSLLTKTRWKMSGEPIWARYNSPFRPPFMRSNEVMVPVMAPVE
ncbi:MAG: heme-binding protein [Proteobacteria bacterium]|nr:heme-binding protein [Pseudomonadota bacterium]